MNMVDAIVLALLALGDLSLLIHLRRRRGRHLRIRHMYWTLTVAVRSELHNAARRQVLQPNRLRRSRPVLIPSY
jgi:hypothetical protein